MAEISGPACLSEVGGATPSKISYSNTVGQKALGFQVPKVGLCNHLGTGN